MSESFSPPLPPTNANALGPVTGTIGGLNQSVTMPALGAANFVVWVQPGSPNFVGTLSSSDSTTGGSRRLFKTGVGPLEVSSEKLDGTQAALEYRASGGTGLTISASAYTSGSCTVTIWALYTPIMVFNNGPVHTTYESALRGGRAFIASTGNVSVAANNYLNFVVANPAGSGRNMFLYTRKYNQNTANVLFYGARSNPTALTGAQSVTPANLRSDSTTTSVCTFNYTVATTTITTGTAIASGMIGINGADELIDTISMLAPGQSRGYFIGGSGGGLTATAFVSVDLVWIEEGIN